MQCALCSFRALRTSGALALELQSVSCCPEQHAYVRQHRARLPTVCRAWQALCRPASQVWKTIYYDAHQQPRRSMDWWAPDHSNWLRWLEARLLVLESLTIESLTDVSPQCACDWLISYSPAASRCRCPFKNPCAQLCTLFIAVVPLHVCLSGPAVMHSDIFASSLHCIVQLTLFTLSCKRSHYSPLSSVAHWMR